MVKCSNCKRELKWHEHKWDSEDGQVFCSLKCRKEYNSKKGHVGNKCPFCSSTRIQAISVGKTQGFNTGTGCCGAILLGPFGWLCGMSGMGKGKTEAKRMCMKCGRTF